MAQKPIDIDMVMNARGVQSGVRDVEAALADVSGSLDDVAADAQRAESEMADSLGNGARDGARDAERATEQISRGLDGVERDAARAGRELGDEIRDGARDAEDSTDRLTRSFRELADASARETRAAGDQIRQNVREGADGASEAMGTFRDETVQNLSSTVSSFRGDMGDIAQLAQDTLGGVTADLGPVGLALGAAGAVGLGLVTAAIEKANEREEEFRENVSELSGELIDAGGDGAALFNQWADAIRDLAVQTEKGETNLDDLNKAAKEVGYTQEDVQLAYAKGGRALEDLLDKIREQIKVQGEAARKAADAAAIEEQRGAAGGRAYLKETEGLRAVEELLESRQELLSAAGDAAETASASVLEALQAEAEAMETYQGAIDDAIGAYADFEDAETGALDPQGYIDSINARIEATTSFNQNVQTMAEKFGLSQEEIQTLIEQGVDFAPMLQKIIDGGDEMQAQYVEAIRSSVDAGQNIVQGNPIEAHVTANTDAAKASIEDAATDRETTIEAKPDTRAAEQALDRTADKPRTAKITAQADTKAAAHDLTEAARTRTVTLRARAELWAAEQALDRLTQPRTVRLTVDTVDREGRPVK